MRELLRDEARSAGLGRREVTLRAVDRRRTELWALAVSVIAAMAVLASPASSRAPGFLGEAPAWTVRGCLALLAIAFFAYVVEKESHLRRLQSVLVDERVLTLAFAERADQLVSLAEGARAVNSVLDLDEVLARLLDRALTMLDAEAGSVLLAEVGRSPRDREYLRAACVRGGARVIGERVTLSTGPVALAVSEGRAAVSPRPALPLRTAPALPSPSDSNSSAERAESPTSRDRVTGAIAEAHTVVAPLVHRGEVLGAVELHGAPGQVFGEYEVQILAVFADYVAAGLVNARAYHHERARVAELMAIDAMKSQFLATVSHELKTPLTSIVGCASVLRRTEVDDDEHAELLDSIDRQARRLGEMVDQLLVAGRLDEARPDPHAIADLAEAVRIVAADLDHTGRRVELIAPAECWVRCESDPLQQVLVNLLDNAFKYGTGAGDPGPVSVEVALRGGKAICSVLDRGPGVPADSRELIFQRFHRLDQAGSLPGMGLGLGIVRQIVEAHGGRVWVDDRPGGGAAMRFTLDAAVREARGAPSDTLGRTPAPST